MFNDSFNEPFQYDSFTNTCCQSLINLKNQISAINILINGSLQNAPWLMETVHQKC